MPTGCASAAWHQGELIDAAVYTAAGGAPGRARGTNTADALRAQGAGRFAPSTSGPPHPGTLASALLVWLDARARGEQALLRFEDLDPARAKTAYVTAIRARLEHMGLVFDDVSYQSHQSLAHAQALDSLADAGRLYACTCRRADIKERLGLAQGHAPQPAYDNQCRAKAPVDRGSWRTHPHALRVRLPDGRVEPTDLGGRDLAQRPAEALGDPIVRRMDGSVAYVLASVVDDARADVGHVVRGADLAPLSATQVALMQLLALPVPTFFHHPLLLDAHGRKWSKTKAAIAMHEPAPLPPRGAALVGQLAHALGLAHDPTPIDAARLAARFSWDDVVRHDVTYLASA